MVLRNRVVLFFLVSIMPPPVSAGGHTAVRVVTVSDRRAAETILSRLVKDAPLALGARGIAKVRTLLEKQIRPNCGKSGLDSNPFS